MPSGLYLSSNGVTSEAAICRLSCRRQDLANHAAGVPHSGFMRQIVFRRFALRNKSILQLRSRFAMTPSCDLWNPLVVDARDSHRWWRTSTSPAQFLLRFRRWSMTAATFRRRGQSKFDTSCRLYQHRGSYFRLEMPLAASASFKHKKPSAWRKLRYHHVCATSGTRWSVKHHS